MPDLDAVLDDLRSVLTSGVITKGRFLDRLEHDATELVGAECVGVSSCTSGLLMALMALKIDGECLVPSFTFMATASPPQLLGLPIRFVDIDPSRLTVSVDAVRAAVRPATTAVIAVHTFGTPADVAALEQLCREKGLALIFDSAHGLGARRRGRPVGDGGDAESFSLSPTKLVTAGEGGLVSTTHHEVAEALRQLRDYGNDGSYNARFPGINARLPEMSAVLAVHSLEQLETSVAARHHLVGVVRECLAATPGLAFQQQLPGDRSSYQSFCVLVDEKQFGMSRDRLRYLLRLEGVDTRTYFDPLVHEQDAFKHQASEALHESTRIARQALSLPLWNDMPEDVARRIAALIVRAQQSAPRVARAPVATT